MSVRTECVVILACVLGTLLLASLVAATLRRCFRTASAQPVLDNLTARIKAWWVMVILVGGAILAGSHAVIILFALVSLVALRESQQTMRSSTGAC